MTIPKSLKRWIVLVAVLVAGLPSFALGDDLIPLQGKSLSLDEMADTRGGLSLPGGGFMEFSMEYLTLEFQGTSDPESPYTSTLLNSIQQEVSVTDEGIEFSMDILHGYSGDGSEEDASSNPGNSTPSQINSIMAVDSFTGFSGLANTNLIAGNNNIGSIVNIFNIQVDFFSARDYMPATPLGLVIP